MFKEILLIISCKQLTRQKANGTVGLVKASEKVKKGTKHGNEN